MHQAGLTFQCQRQIWQKPESSIIYRCIKLNVKVDRPNEEALEEDLLMLTFFLLLKIGSFYYYHLDRQHVGGILKVKLQWCCCVSWLTYVIVFNRQFSWNGRSWDCVCGWLRGRKARPEDPHWQRGQASKGASQKRAQTCLRRPGSHVLFLALMLICLRRTCEPAFTVTLWLEH